MGTHDWIVGPSPEHVAVRQRGRTQPKYVTAHPLQNSLCTFAIHESLTRLNHSLAIRSTLQ